MIQVEKKTIDFIKKYYVEIFAIILTIIAVYIRVKLLKYKSGDFKIFLNPWFDYLKDNGGIKALRNYPGDYNAPYMTILALLTYIPINCLYTIKAVSIVFDFLLACVCRIFNI